MFLSFAWSTKTRRSMSVDGQKATDATSYLNEPAVTGGNPILADEEVLFNDMLGTTLGSVKNGTFNEIGVTSFGANESQTSKPPVAHRFFTGKPHVDGLGYAFLFRNYRPELGKWQTSDPLGYPDGWNNFAYVNNWVTGCIDWLGAETVNLNLSVIKAGTISINTTSTSITHQVTSIGQITWALSGNYDEAILFSYTVTIEHSGSVKQEDGRSRDFSLIHAGTGCSGYTQSGQYGLTMTSAVAFYVTAT